MKNKKLNDLVLTAILSALIVVMTVVPYTGYISYGTFLEITTLHLVVILGSVFLGWKHGAILGAVWGLTSFARAFTNPLWALFTNPLISVLPRIIVGIVAGSVSAGLFKTRLNKYLSISLSAICGTLTNTVLVLTAIYLFSGLLNTYTEFFELFKTIIMTTISINGLVEIIAAAILIPAIYFPISKTTHTREE